jgi:hypothetical protein
MTFSPVRMKDFLEAMTSGYAASGSTIQHAMGADADAEHTNAERAVWIPSGIDTADLPYQVADDVTPTAQAVAFRVALHADTFDALLIAHELLVGWIDHLVGPRRGAPASQDGTRPQRGGYDIGKSEPKMRSAGLSGQAWGVVVPVTLKRPLRSLHTPPRAIVSVAVEVAASPEDGSQAELAVRTGEV